ncbi:hypothetical protein [Lonepinella koalarum]|uniref:hypothetical protein n=1 Tax=Lonepinella koalarum TaxID=53417 RepID=UPI003F6DB884
MVIPFTSFMTLDVAILATTRRARLNFSQLGVEKPLFGMTKRQVFRLDLAKIKL